MRGAEEREKHGLFFGVAVFIFIVSIISSAGLFIYKKIVLSEVGNLGSQLASAEASLDRKSINQILLFESKLKSIKEITNNHVAISEYFKMLERNTVKELQFTSLRYNAPPGSNISINMNGKAKSYATVALEENVFKKDPNTLSINFNNLKLNKKDGTVSFTMSGEFKNDLIKFKPPSEAEAIQGLEEGLLDLENI